jgi:hypothetical protein
MHNNNNNNNNSLALARELTIPAERLPLAGVISAAAFADRGVSRGGSRRQ